MPLEVTWWYIRWDCGKRTQITWWSGDLIFDQVSLEKITWEEAPLPFRLHLKPSHLKTKVGVPIKLGVKSLFRRNTDLVWLTMEELWQASQVFIEYYSIITTTLFKHQRNWQFDINNSAIWHWQLGNNCWSGLVLSVVSNHFFKPDCHRWLHVGCWWWWFLYWNGIGMNVILILDWHWNESEPNAGCTVGASLSFARTGKLDHTSCIM